MTWSEVLYNPIDNNWIALIYNDQGHTVAASSFPDREAAQQWLEKELENV